MDSLLQKTTKVEINCCAKIIYRSSYISEKIISYYNSGKYIFNPNNKSLTTIQYIQQVKFYVSVKEKIQQTKESEYLTVMMAYESNKTN